MSSVRPEHRAGVRAIVADKYAAYLARRDTARTVHTRCTLTCTILPTPCIECAEWYWDTHGDDAPDDAKAYATRNPSCLLLLEVARPELAGFVAGQLAETQQRD